MDSSTTLLTAWNLYYDDNGLLYVNQQLSYETLNLLYPANKSKANHNFEYVRATNQKVFLRGTQDSQPIQIQDQSLT